MRNLIVRMQGELEPIGLQDSFAECANRLNMAAAHGKQFAATVDEDGRNILLNVPNINTIIEVESADDDFGMVG